MKMWRWSLELFLVCFAAVDTASVLSSDEPHRVLVSVVTALSVLVLCGRKYAPLTVSVTAFLLLALGMNLSPKATGVQFLGMVLTFLIVGVVNRGPWVWLAATAGFGTLVYGTLVSPDGGGWSDLALSAAICEGLLLAGWLLARRSLQVSQMRIQAELSEDRERERTRSALAEERARIAREMHDVVSHGLSVVVVQSQAARSAVEDLASTNTTAVAGHLDAVEATARDALAEMRRMLGLLQLGAVDDDAPAPPTPDLASLPALIERARLAGLSIVEELPARGVSLGSGLELTIYRIVQESLTNVVKHAPGSRTSVRVDAGADVVEVRVHSAGEHALRLQGGTCNSGHGLVGMRERVRMYGGQLDVGPTTQPGFEVHASLPIAASAPFAASQ
ncbi:MAG: sensor histidine kinase [Nocardioidaceae bacterium]